MQFAEREHVGFNELLGELQGRVLNTQFGIYSGDTALTDLAMTDWPAIETMV
jgi:hypothetical protein